MRPVERITSPDRIDWAALRPLYAGWGLRQDASLGDVAHHCRGHLTYLATPYSRQVVDHEDGAWDPNLSDDLGMVAAKWSRDLAIEGVTAISPILICVEMIARDFTGALDPLDHMFWSTWCRPLLRRSEVVIVPPIPGWDESLGVWQEVRWALMHQVPVFLISEDQE